MNDILASKRTGWPARLAAPGRGLLLVGLALAEAVVACVVAAASMLIPLGVGLYLFPPSVAWLSGLAERARGYARRWSGVTVARPEPARPAVPAGLLGRVRWCWRTLTDREFWCEYRWSLVDPIVGAFVAGIPFALVVYGVFGALVQPFVWQPIDRAGGSNWYTFVHVNTGTRAMLAVPIAVAVTVLGLWCGPWLLRVHARLTRALLTLDRTAELTRRVEQLAGTRAAAVDSSAAELRRIERDLHDGAQARLVAMGMSLSNAERLIERDPETARALVAEVRQSSSKALQELRDLVRGIHPPVLADRGLPDAVRALALDSPLEVQVDARLAHRLPPPLESAVYFAVNELLANTAKHSGADRVDVAIALDEGLLRVRVRDDGCGGADPSRGSGLRGVQRRLAAFDGALRVHSPAGGPTVIELEIPCGS
ncbi:Signal transduction histidine kinase [Micromonospora viridifaciens]|uniref:histidine kinase n=1 Tax=Micromonospora viridifaciens TaxID=1881 RepID=A0A1C4YDT6_MICVI|nr:sensor histidine kinase [Micromonospora viridifaciens]SCF18844.1 Signal transduction histidine kinase [Micromonospora viridifaciens]